MAAGNSEGTTAAAGGLCVLLVELNVQLADVAVNVVADLAPRRTLTRRMDFALFIIDALRNDELVHEDPLDAALVTDRARQRRHRLSGRSSK